MAKSLEEEAVYDQLSAFTKIQSFKVFSLVSADTKVLKLHD